MRKAFTLMELVAVILIIGILAGIIVPKFRSFSDQAKKSSEIVVASAVASALDRIEGEWSINDGDFDWNHDGIVDDIQKDLSSAGYPYHLDRDGKTFGAVLKRDNGDKFVLQASEKVSSKALYSIFTGPASDPINGVKFSNESSNIDIPYKPDKNDFWLYVIEANATNKGCFVKGDHIDTKQVVAGDFILIDVKGKKRVDFKRDDLGMHFRIECD